MRERKSMRVSPVGAARSLQVSDGTDRLSQSGAGRESITETLGTNRILNVARHGQRSKRHFLRKERLAAGNPF